MFQAVLQANVTAILWYSTQANWCSLSYTGSYEWVYTMTSLNDTRTMLDNINALSGDSAQGGDEVYFSIGATNSESQANNGTSGGGNGNGNGLSLIHI